MNITNFRATPVSEVYAAVKHKASRHRARIVRGELIGLVPEAAFEQETEWVRQLVGFNPQEKILERKLGRPLDWP
jgi:glutamate formiminotransferase